VPPRFMTRLVSTEEWEDMLLERCRAGKESLSWKRECESQC